MAAIHDILRHVATLSALPAEDIPGDCRERMYIRARMVVAHFARAEGYTYSRIGDVLGGRDHSTIVNLVKKATIWRGKDPLFDRLMDRMTEAMREGRVIVPVVKLKLREPQDWKDEFKQLPFDSVTRRDHHQMAQASRNLLAALEAVA